MTFLSAVGGHASLERVNEPSQKVTKNCQAHVTFVWLVVSTPLKNISPSRGENKKYLKPPPSCVCSDHFISRIRGTVKNLIAEGVLKHHPVRPPDGQMCRIRTS